MSAIRKILIINGAERSFICDPQNDTLADAIRSLGLTGTKVGCNAGQCGACNVILNGKLTRACVKKIKTVEDFSTVYTIEGMGTAENLHPIQLAWIVYGGVQCGFCTPGFIVSTKALLDENSNPTREEVRAWFQKNRNACRCTGYKPLVDAVMAAAKVMRGEMTMEELAYKGPKDKLFNTRAPKPTAIGKVLGTTNYGDDINVKTQGMLHLAPVMAGISHGIIKSIDTSEAEKMPGVFQIITSKDVKGTNRIFIGMGSNYWAEGSGHDTDRPILSEEKIYRPGDIVAVVAADTRRHAREAAKLVKVICDPLPEYTDVLDSVQDDALEIHPGMPNLFLKKPLFHGEDTRNAISKAAHVAEFSVGTQQQSHLPIEPDTGNAYLDDDGIVTIMIKAHSIYTIRNAIAAGIGMPIEKIRIILNPSGGSFGYACAPDTAAILGVCAMVTGRPVGITFSYEEHQLFTGKRQAAYSNARLACDENGKLVASECEVLYSNGAFAENASIYADLALKFYLNPYTIPNARLLFSVAYANTPFCEAYRCPAIVESKTNEEQLIDILAEKAGIDPFEFRYKNVWREGDIAIYGEKPTVYVVPDMLDKLRPTYAKLLDHAKNNSTAEKRLGVGVALGCFQTSWCGDHAEVALELNPDSTVTVYNTWEDMGQGADIGALSIAHEALRPLGFKPDQIKLVMNDTAVCPDTGFAAGSRSNIMYQQAIKNAAELLKDAMRKQDGTLRTYDEMFAEKIATKYIGTFDQPVNPKADEKTGFGRTFPDQSYCAFVTEVEVDVNTGKTKVLDMHCATDVGVVTNYLSIEGQAYGGMQHSIGYALSEQFSDMKKHTSLAGAGFPYIEMIPDGNHFTLTVLETPRDHTAFGGSGASEGFQSAGHAAILNAIYKAVGIRVSNLPATPEKVKKAIEEKKNGTYKPQEKYYLGSNFHETLDYMQTRSR
ncbi:MAG: molybdopterin-dependent oxidoreductase [Clostridiaceae bacterium]|nr:molybdopterin-dependent oxidoreductase [Clostridiaceae bacterium]